MTQAPVTLSTELARPSPYHLGDGIAEALPAELLRHEFDELFLVTSEPLHDRFGRDLTRTLTGAGIEVTAVTVCEGESAKSWDALAELCERLIAAGVTRDSIVLGLGGGMVSNLAGLAAALIYRGVRYVDVPTTLLAITDGVLSNKQAINGARGKNQFGVYRAPLFIWADVAYVRHEPLRNLRSAVVEAVKNGLVNDAAWVATLEETLDPELTRVRDDLLGFARAMVESKLAILRQDPSERALGTVLEYGHTVGHALEWLSGGRLLHGEAVAIGMNFAARLGVRLGVTPPEVLARQEHLLGRLLGCPADPPAGRPDPDRVMELLLTDNKHRGGDEVRFVLLEDIARPHDPCGDHLTPVPQPVVKSALAETWAEA